MIVERNLIRIKARILLCFKSQLQQILFFTLRDGAVAAQPFFRKRKVVSASLAPDTLRK